MKHLLVLCLLLCPSLLFAQADLTVPLPPGETALGDIGMYRVAYQSYGGQPVYMPDSWVGSFEPVAGISYLPGEKIMGRKALLLHSPWHIAPGKMWVDYRLKLPKLTPITLSFSIAMRADIAVPGKSDGVTFGAYVGEQELLHENYTAGQWKDYAFDISKRAGETITLRLQVEPGPKNNPSFDFSYFGDPKIICGASSQAKQALLQQLTATKAYKATADKNLLALSNRSGKGVTPSNLLDFKNRVTMQGSGFDFTCEGADGLVRYHYEPETGTLDDFTCSVDGGDAFRPASGGGVFGEVREGERTSPVLVSGGKLLSSELKANQLHVRWQYDVAGRPVPVEWTFGISGKALTVSATCDQPVLVALSLGRITGAPLRRSVPVPYLPGSGLFYLPAQNVFVNRYLDWTVSHSSRCPQGEASYDRKTDGTLNPLLESGYIGVSPNVNEVLPNIPWEASPYLKLLGDRIMLDVWGHHRGTYQGDAENLRDLKDNGVDHLAIIQHVWQRYGYDVKLPDHIPADPRYGGDEGMIAFGKAANECGYVWSCHENYIDLYPDAPSYDETACVLKSDGTKSLAWYNPGTKMQSFGLKCNRAKGFAEQNSPYIHKTYGTTAAYLDVHTCVPPWHQLDHQADQPMAAMALAKVKYDSELFQYMRDTHGGPLFGEGNNQFYWAGKCDGVEAQVNGGEDHTPFLDLDLLKLHPQMVNHGMGYYERWFATMRESRWGRNCGSMEQIDKYRAQTLAYGHAGFIGSTSTANVQWVAKEHNLLGPLQALYGASKPVSIQYEAEGKLVPASVALAMGDTSRQRIEYDSGLVVWVNWDKEAWKVGDTTLPQWGFLATGPGTRVCSSLQGSSFVDYAENAEFAFADARTSFNMPYLRAEKNIEPKLKALEYLGGNKVRLTYEWHVGEKPEDDYFCFVHFTNPGVGETDNIVFQQDHRLLKPTTQWQPGEIVTDGPWEVSIPDGDMTSYDLTIGLFRGPRLSLKGLRDGNQRIVLARLKVTRENGKVTGVTLADMAEVARDYNQDPEIDFTTRMNKPGTMLTIGKITTDGSVKVNKAPNRLTVFPYPRDKEFTVGLDVKALAPQADADPQKLEVHALAALTQADLGKVETKMVQGRLTFKVGKPGAGRYVVTW